MYIKRHIEAAVHERAREKGATVVTGARQTGKTTLFDNLLPDIARVSFDDLDMRAGAKDEPAAFLQLHPPPLFIDEVQYVPDLFSYIKISLDASKQKGQFYLTGAQKFELMKNASESLAGRAGILQLLGLSLREMRSDECRKPFLPTTEYLLERKSGHTALDIKSLWQIIHRGSMPELFVHQDYNWRNFYADYVKTYLERDVRRLTQVADEASFMQFMAVCAAMTGQILNMASLARDVGISEPTAKRWLSILQTSGIVYLLRPYFTNAIKRLKKSPKLYFLDTGLAAYLTKWLTPETLAGGAASGHYFETFIIAELLKSYANAGLEEDFYYLRDGGGREIDLLIFQDNTLYPIEIKKHTSPTADDIRHFEMLQSILGISIGEGGVVCPAANLLPLKNGNKIIPLWAV